MSERTTSGEEPRSPEKDAPDQTGDQPGKEQSAESEKPGQDIPLEQRQMNEVMDRQAEADQQAEAEARSYPPGAEIPSADNVRRYPELFADEVRAGFDEELPETDHEKQLAEQAAEADKKAGEKGKAGDKGKTSTGQTDTARSETTEAAKK